MRRDTIIQVAASAVLCLTLVIAGALSMGLTTSASKHKLTYTVQIDKSDPPEVALGIAMGAFRGLFVNFLWLRANDLKEEGKYHEAVDLASTITKLQPRFSEVWAFHAWNLAYNISVTTHTIQERWYWVRSGLDLLRNEGVVYNPDDLRIHKELGWILLHKIQGYTDDANGYYKRQWAIEWTEVLGEPPILSGLESREEQVRIYADWLRPIVEAPESIEDLIARDEKERADERREGANGVRDLVDRLAASGWKLDVATLRQYTYCKTLSESGSRDVLLKQMPPQRRALYDLVTDQTFRQAWAKLLPHLRRRVLMDEYNMEPERMLRYTQIYGPMDWRHPAAHAVYWVRRGVDGALTRVEEQNRKDFDFLNTDRIWIQSVQELYRSGMLFFDYNGYVTFPENPQLFLVGRTHPYFAYTYQDSLLELQKRAGLFESREERIWTFYAAGFENFVKDVIRYFYRRGQKDLAAQWKENLITWANANPTQGREERLSLPLDEFIIEELRERMDSPSVAQSEIFAALEAAYLVGILQGNKEIFDSNVAYAQLCHRYYFDKQGRPSAVAGAPGPKEVYIPRDFRVVMGSAFVQAIWGLDIDAAETLYRRAPDDLKPFAYDYLVENIKPRMDAQVAQGGRAFDLVFPEPPGMQAHRERLAEAMRRQAQAAQRATELK